MPALRHPIQYLRHYFVPGAHNAYRPRILHRPILIFFLAIILATEGFLVSNLVARQSDEQFLAAVVPAEIISLTNDQRKLNSDNALTEDTLLDQAAQAKAQDMAAKDYFSHVGPDGKTPWQWISEVGYQYQYAGENLAVRFVDSEDVVQAWMASPTHRANIVKPVYTEIGVGVALGTYQGQPATYVVQYFGTPKNANPAAVRTAPQAPPHSVPGVSGNPQVQGAETSAPAPVPPQNSFMQSVIRQLVRAFSEPQQLANIIIGFVAILLVLVLISTFFVHLQVQHPTMLATGAFVVAVAIFFLVLNMHLVGGTVRDAWRYEPGEVPDFDVPLAAARAL